MRSLGGEVMALLYAPMLLEKSGKEFPVALASRDWFPDSGILLVRPDPGAGAPRLAVAIKGGDNGESHNHNDNGTFITSCSTGAASSSIRDPETYTARTFSAHRYDGKVLSGIRSRRAVVDGMLLERPARRLAPSCSPGRNLPGRIR